MVPNRFGSDAVVILAGIVGVTMNFNSEGGKLVFMVPVDDLFVIFTIFVIVGATDTTGGGLGKIAGGIRGISTFFCW